MASAWFKLQHDVPNDLKWQAIARMPGQPVVVVVTVYIHLLVSTLRNATVCHGASLRSHIDIMTENLTGTPDVTEEVIDSVLQAMREWVLDGDLVARWEKYQVPEENNGNVSQAAKSPVEHKRTRREREKLRRQNKGCRGKSRICYDMSRRVTADKDTDKESNPAHDAYVHGSVSTSEPSGTPLWAAEPASLDGLGEPTGKSPMVDDWHPSLDFQRRVALWGMVLPEPEPTPVELAAPQDYWAMGGGAFVQIQWEQKFARHVNHVRAQVKLVNKGINRAATPGGIVSRAVQGIQAACERQEHENGFINDGNGLEAVRTRGGGLSEPLDPEERGRTFEALDCTSRRDD